MAGVEVVPHAGHLEAADGQHFGLWNLAATCRQAPGGESDWPEIVQSHVARMVRAVSAPALDALPAEQVLAAVYPRVVGTHSLPPEWKDWYSYARPLAHDLVELLALDLPDSVTVLRDEDVARIGRHELDARARQNLLALPLDECERFGDPGAGAVHVVEGESFFTASRILAFPELLEAALGSGEAPYGVMVALPTRHMLAFHVIHGPDLVPAVNRLTGFAAKVFGEAPGGVSPFVYWWRAGELTQVTGFDDDGALQVHVDGDLAELLNRFSGEA